MVYDILFEGPFELVEIIYDKMSIIRTQEQNQLIEEIWKNVTKENPYIYNGDLVGIKQHQTAQNRLEVQVCKSTYKEFIGTRDSFYVKKFGMKNIANPLSVCALIITSDDKIVLGKRSKFVDLSKLKLTIPSGWIDPSKDLKFNKIDAFEVIKRETGEELGIYQNELTLKCLGLVFNRMFNHSFIPFWGITKLDSSTIFERKRNDEFSELVKFENNVGKLLSKHHEQLSDVAKATLFLYKKALNST